MSQLIPQTNHFGHDNHTIEFIYLFNFESVLSHYIASYYTYPFFFVTLSHFNFNVYCAFIYMINILNQIKTFLDELMNKLAYSMIYQMV